VSQEFQGSDTIVGNRAKLSLHRIPILLLLRHCDHNMGAASVIAYLLGAAAISVGMLPFISPSKAEEVFGIPPASSPSDPSQHPITLQSTSPFLVAKGARDITLGLCYVAFAYQKDFRALRTLMVAHGFTGAVDSILVWRLGRSDKALGHGLGTLCMGIVLILGKMD
jgi:Domain of unknown function (DUF4267)